MALLRDVQNLCPKEVLNFILDLIKYNDNRKNKVREKKKTIFRKHAWKYVSRLVKGGRMHAGVPIDLMPKAHGFSIYCCNYWQIICQQKHHRTVVIVFFPLQFSDNYYRAELIDALTNSLTPAISINNEVRTVDNLNADVRLILEEITRFLNMEKLLPSYRNTITVRCVFPLHACVLCKFGWASSNARKHLVCLFTFLVYSTVKACSHKE